MNNILNLISNRVIDYYNINENTLYVIEEVPARTLLRPERIDVLLKLYYIESRVENCSLEYATKVFLEQVKAITAFTNKEAGQADKQSAQAFISTFDKLIDSFKCEGYDKSISIIPVSSEGIILDGAHRLACAIYFDQVVTIVRFPHIKIGGTFQPTIYDQNYFKRFLLKDEYIELAIHQYVKYAKGNIYIACFWPVANNEEKRNEAISTIYKNYPVIYKKECKLSYKAFCKFTAQVYMHDVWVGSIENDFAGSENKAMLTYRQGSPVTFVIFEGGSKEETLKLKDEIREIFNIGKHSVHITDNTQETKIITDIILNTNSMSFLESSNTKRNSETIRKIFNMDDCMMFNLEASKCTFGFVPYKEGVNLVLNNNELKDSYKVDDLLRIPSCYFVYLRHKFLYPSKDILNKYLSSYDKTDIIVERYSKYSQIKEMLYYRWSYIRLNVKRSLINIVSKSQLLFNTLRAIKKLIK